MCVCERETDRQTETETETDRQTDGQTDREGKIFKIKGTVSQV